MPWRISRRPLGGGSITDIGSLSVISVGFLVMLFASSVSLWLGLGSAYLRHRHLHRRRWAIGIISACALLLSIVAAADTVNAHFQYLPRLSDVLGQRDWPTLNAKLLAADAGSPNRRQPPPTTSSWPLASPSSAIGSPTPTGAPTTTPDDTLQPIHPSGSSLSPTAPGTRPRGAVVTITVADRGVGFPAGHALVYLPPQYFADPAARFPVVYLLHGSPGMPVDWLRGGGAADAGLRAATHGRPQILVMPHLSRNWLDDSECVDGAHMKVETYVVTDLLPAVDDQLRTVDNRGGRTIGGMSAGGYCALNLGLRHRDLFGSIIDMSGYTRPTHAGGVTTLFGARTDLAQVVAANSPDVYAPTLTANPSTRIFLLCGKSDKGPLTQMAAIRPVLQSRGLQVTWTTLPGSHTYGVWRPGLVDALAWAGMPAAHA